MCSKMTGTSADSKKQVSELKRSLLRIKTTPTKMTAPAVTKSSTVDGSGATHNAWNQLDQLLTCAICLDRFRNPKLLPCQHTFCMEPCIEGLIDYVRRQIKCPECRAEHRIPYQGIQGYPTNVTLMRFLELHFEVSGETPDPTPTIRERCGVCSEKSYLTLCAHCEKKVCPDCKEAHLEILKREISRVNNQVRRGLHRLQDALIQAEKSVQLIEQNSVNLSQEIEEVYHRLQKELKDREENLKNEVQVFQQTELKNLTQLKDNLEIEVANIQSNCELVEQHVTESSEWEDAELVDYKETFLRTLEFVRNFDTDQADFNRRLKFQAGTDPEIMHQSIAQFGELTLNIPQFVSTNSVTAAPNLMRSKSDHRLATQFHRQEEARNYLGITQRFGGHSSDTESRGDGRSSSPFSRRRAGDGTDFVRRSVMDEGDRYSTKRYGRESTGNLQRDDDSGGGYKSRFLRDSDVSRDSSEADINSLRSVRFAKDQQPEITNRERVLGIEDAMRGPISGIARLMDSPQVLRRLQQNEQQLKIKQEEKKPQPPPKIEPAPPPATQQPVRRTQRQVSEDDEIAKIKAQNKTQTTQPQSQTTAITTTTTPPTDTSVRPLVRRVTSLQKAEENRTATAVHSNSQDVQATDNGRRKAPTNQEETNVDSSVNGTNSATKSVNDGAITSPSSSRSTSRQVSREEFKTPPSTPTRKLSLDQRSENRNEPDRAPADEDSRTAVARRRFYNTRSQNEARDRSLALKTSVVSAPISEVPKGATVEDSDKQSSDNVFRSPSNSSLNLTSPDSQDESSKQPAPKPSATSPVNAGRGNVIKPAEISKRRSESTSSTSSESSSSSSSANTPTVNSPTVPTEKLEEKPIFSAASRKPDKKDEKKTDPGPSPRPRLSSLANVNKSSYDQTEEKKADPKPKFVSRFLPRQASSVTSDNRGDSSSESESDSEDEKKRQEEARDASINALLARSAMARRESSGGSLANPRDRRDDTSSSASTLTSYYGRDRDDSGTSSNVYTRKPGSYLYGRDDKKDTDSTNSRYSSLTNKYLTRSRPVDDEKDYGSYTSRYLSRSKSSAAVVHDIDNSPDDATRRTGTGTGSDLFRKKSRFSALRRNRIGRSRSSHDIWLHDDDEDDQDLGSTSYQSSRPTRDTAASSSSIYSTSNLRSRPSTYKPTLTPHYTSRY